MVFEGCEGLKYSSENAEKVWQEIQDILHEKGRVSEGELAEGLADVSDLYPHKTFRHALLPQMRECLLEADMIEVEVEKREKQNMDTKIWKIKEE